MHRTASSGARRGDLHTPIESGQSLRKQAFAVKATFGALEDAGDKAEGVGLAVETAAASKGTDQALAHLVDHELRRHHLVLR